MFQRSFVLAFTLLAISAGGVLAEDPIGVPDGTSLDDWPWWRGPARIGVAPCDTAPKEWSPNESVLWRAEVPGRGHASPTVAGDRVFLPTALEDEQVQLVLCFDRGTGRELWRHVVHEGNFDKGGNARGSHASSTIACDGERVFVNFLNDNAVWTTALSPGGEELWRTRIGDFVNHQGFGSSPAIYGDLVLVSADHKGGGVLRGLDRRTGESVWKVERPAKANYTSPVLLDVSGKHQAIFAGCDLVTGLDPATGKTLWETEGSTTECVTSVVPSNGLVFTSGGYPRNHMQAVHTDGSGRTAWENNTRVYVPSMVAHEGRLFAVTDDGIAVCHDAATGELLWRERLGGKFNASLVLVGDLVYATAEDGTTTIFRASPDGFAAVATNDLGDEVFATPSICGERIYHRVVVKQGEKRQEWLYCLGE